MDNVLLAMEGTTSQLGAYILSGAASSHINAASLIQLNQWYHIAFVLNGTTGFIYVNGIQKASGTLFQPNHVIRSSNFIGKHGDPNVDAIYDDLKIYHGAVSAAEVL